MTAPTPVSVRPLRAAIVIVAVLLALGLLYATVSSANPEPLYAYSDLLADAAAGDVEAIEQDGTILYVSFQDGLFATSYVASESVNVYAEVCAATGDPIGPDCSIYYAVLPADQADEWVGLLISALVPVLLIGVFFFFMMRQAQKTSSPILVRLADSSSPEETAK